LFSVEVQANVGGVEIHTTNNRGMTPEEVAIGAVNKIESEQVLADSRQLVFAEAVK